MMLAFSIFYVTLSGALAYSENRFHNFLAGNSIPGFYDIPGFVLLLSVGLVCLFHTNMKVAVDENGIYCWEYLNPFRPRQILVKWDDEMKKSVTYWPFLGRVIVIRSKILSSNPRREFRFFNYIIPGIGLIANAEEVLAVSQARAFFTGVPMSENETNVP